MKKLLLIILFLASGFHASAMQQDINAQNEQGNTQLHNAVLAWQKSTHAAHIKSTEYDALVTQFKKIKQEIKAEKSRPLEKNGRVNQYDVDASQQKLKRLSAEQTALVEKANEVKTEYTLHKKQVLAQWQEAVRLIENGSRINIPNNERKTVEQLCRDLVQKYVYLPLWQAIKNDDAHKIKQFLSIGANPEFTNKHGDTALKVIASEILPKSAELLLLHGARLNASMDGLSPLHIAASHNNNEFIRTVLECPQGGPAYNAPQSVRLKNIHLQIVTLACYLNHLGLPQEVKEKIYSHALPDVHELIGLVSLPQLSKYKKIVDKQALINALINRHEALVGKALNATDIYDLQPHILARHPFMPQIDDEFVIIDDPNETSKMLDPEEYYMAKHKEKIIGNYKKLLE